MNKVDSIINSMIYTEATNTFYIKNDMQHAIFVSNALDTNDNCDHCDFCDCDGGPSW